jgi:lipopolysaccharide export system protein LptA
VIVSYGPYVGRSEAASYEAATGRLTLTGKPVLADDKGGSARGAKLTFDLTDDKIFIENEGSGRATTVVRS